MSSSTSSSSNPLILTYHDATIYASDLELIRSSTGWLNDHCISFWLQYLRHDILPSCAATRPPTPDDSDTSQSTSTSTDQQQCLHTSIEMLDPGAVFMLRFVPTEDLTVATHDNVYLRLARAGLVSFPLNDNLGAESAGGSHWSLLIWHQV
jgi:hypothetical protein